MKFDKNTSNARRYKGIIDWYRKHSQQLQSLADVYSSFSRAKAYAYGDCKDRSQMICDDLTEGNNIATLWDWGILTHNSHMFTYGAIIRVMGSDGIKWFYHIETPSHRYLMIAE